MKKFRKGIAIFLAATLTAALISGCGTQSAGGENGSTAGSGTGSASKNTPKDAPTVSFTVTTVGFGADPTGTVIQEEWLKKCSEKMGVQLKPKFQFINMNDYKDKITIILTGGDIPDLLSYGWNPGGQTDLIKYGEQGLYLELTQHMDKLPNYKAVIDKAPNTIAPLYSSSGKLYGFYGAQYQPKGYPALVGALGVRKDILDKNNLQIPETIEDYTKVCQALKKAYPDKYPMTQVEEWQRPETTLFAANHTSADLTGKGKSIYYDAGKYVFGPVTDNYKEALQTMRQWYKEGLISPDYFTQTQTDGLAAIAAGDAMTVPSLWQGYPGVWANPSQYPDQKWVLVPNVKNPKYGEPWSFYGSSPDEWVMQKSYSVLVGAKSKVADYMLQLMDLQYSNEMVNLLNWGIKDTTYTEDASGNKTIVQKYLDQPDLQTQLGWGQGSCRSGIFPNPQDIMSVFAKNPKEDIYYNGKLTNEVSDLFAIANIKDNNTCPDSVLYPRPSPLSTEESQEYANIMTPIETYCAEQAASFITGNRSFDQWPAYLEEVKKMGDVQKALDIYNSHLKK